MKILNFGQTVKELRLSKGLSQKELASDICTQAQISKIENNNDMPSVFILSKLAKRLGVDMNYFFEKQEADKVEYLKQSKKYIRKLSYLGEYEEIYRMVLIEKNVPIFRRKKKTCNFCCGMKRFVYIT